MLHPYRLAKQWTATFLPRATSGAMRRNLVAASEGEPIRIPVAVAAAAAVPVPNALEHHAAALCPDAPRGRLQQLHDPRAQPAVADRRRAGGDALGEVGDDRHQRLALLDLRAEDVAASVTHHQPSLLLVRLVHLDAAVVDLD